MLVQEMEERGHGDHALDHRLDDDDGEIDAEQGRPRLLQELDRARAVEKGDVDILMGEVGGRDLGAHLALARLGAAVADGVPVGHPALAADGARDEQKALEKGRLAGAVGPHQCHISDGCARLHVASPLACPDDARWLWATRGGTGMARYSHVCGKTVTWQLENRARLQGSTRERMTISPSRPLRSVACWWRVPWGGCRGHVMPRIVGPEAGRARPGIGRAVNAMR